MRRTRLLLTICVVIALVLTFPMWRWFVGMEPTPANSTQQQLLEWIVLSDLRRHPEQLQIDLVDRLQAEILDGWQPIAGRTASDEARMSSEQARQNIDILTRVWFYQRAQQYLKLQHDDRVPFMEDQLTVVMQWNDVYSAIHSDPSQDTEISDGASNAFALFDTLDHWAATEPDPKLAVKLTSAMHHGVQFWLCTSDLEVLSCESKAKLVERLADALSSGSVNTSDPLVISGEHEQQLHTNAWKLLESWIVLRAMEFVELESSSDREVFVGKQIDAVKDWHLEEYLMDSASQTTGELQLMLTVFSKLDTWIENAPEERKQAVKLLTDAIRLYAIQQLREG